MRGRNNERLLEHLQKAFLCGEALSYKEVLDKYKFRHKIEEEAPSLCSSWDAK